MNREIITEKIYEYGAIWGLKIAGAILIFIVGKIVISILMNITNKILKKSTLDETLTGFITTIVQTLLQIVLWLMILGNLGVQTTSFMAILGAAGLAVGLALQGSLSNFSSGFLLIMFRPFKVGDYVECGGAAGVVKSITIFNTILNSPDNKVIIIPNSSVTGGKIINYSALETRRVDFVFGIGYEDDLKLAKNTLVEIVNGEEKVIREPEPQVVVSELADSSVNFTVRVWVKTPDYWDVYFNIIEKVKLTFDEKNISIPYPQQDIHLYKND